MADLDPKLISDFENLQKILNSVNASFSSYSKSATRRELEYEAWNKRRIQQIQELTKAHGKEGQILAARILAEEEAAEKIEKSKVVWDKWTSQAVNAISGLKNLSTGIISSATSVYNSDKVFTAVIPTVDLMGNTVKTVITALSSLADGIPIISGLSKAAGAASLAAVEISLALTKMRLEGVQKLFDTFQGLQKVGVFLAGEFNNMRSLSDSTGLSYQQLNKFVTQNIDSLSNFGGGLTQAAVKAGSLGKQLGGTDARLLNMYGTYEDLSGAIAGYMSLLSQTGMDQTRMNANLGTAAKNYLVNMKELSELTGINADTIRKEQEARLKHAAYQQALAEMGPEAAAEMQNRVTLITSRYGKSAGDYLEEFIATGGRVVSETGLMFAAGNRPLADMIEQIRSVTVGDGSMAAMAKIISTNQPMLEKFYGGMRNLFQIMYGVNETYLNIIGEAGSAVSRSSAKNTNMIETEAEIRKKLEQALSKDAKNVADAIKSQNEYQRKMDALFTDLIPQTAKMVSQLYDITFKLFDKFPVDKFDGAVDKFVEAVDWLLDQASGKGGKRTSGTVTGEQVNAARVAEGKPPLSAEAAEAEGARQTVGKRGGRRSRSTYIDNLAAFNAAVKSGPDGALKEGEKFDPRLADYLNAYISSEFAKTSGFSVNQITGLDDNYHRDKKTGGKHPLGMAVDFTLGKAPTPEEFELIKKELVKAGFTKVLDEYNKPGKDTTGSHIHAELQQGGVIAGGSGGIVARVGEGSKDELVTPLVNGMLPGMRELIEKMDALVSLNKDQVDHLEQTKYLLS